jgi:hypothetical protein
MLSESQVEGQGSEVAEGSVGPCPWSVHIQEVSLHRPLLLTFSKTSLTLAQLMKRTMKMAKER